MSVIYTYIYILDVKRFLYIWTFHSIDTIDSIGSTQIDLMRVESFQLQSSLFRHADACCWHRRGHASRKLMDGERLNRLSRLSRLTWFYVHVYIYIYVHMINTSWNYTYSKHNIYQHTNTIICYIYIYIYISILNIYKSQISKVYK